MKIEKERMEQWYKEKKTVTLTNKQWSDLDMYLLMRSEHRKEERETWEALANKKNPDGTLAFPNGEETAKFWNEISQSIAEAMVKISNR